MYFDCIAKPKHQRKFYDALLSPLALSTNSATIGQEKCISSMGAHMDTISVFVDESGSIKKGPLGTPDYFVISLIFTDNEKFLKRVFTKKRLKQLTEAEKNVLRESKEIKGSEMSENRKAPIYASLIEKCAENLEIGVVVLDLKHADDRLKQVSSRAFNFLIARYLSKWYKVHSKFKDARSIHFFVDERNVATGAKFTLEEYLNTEYNIEDPICDGDISVHYLDSKNRNLIQLADFVANTFYRAYKKNDPDARNNVRVLEGALCNGKVFYFPIPYIKHISGHII